MGDVLLLETGTDKLLLEDGSSFLLLEVPDTSYSQLILGTTGLVGYWRLGETSGTNAVDAKGTSDGTYTNVAGLQAGVSGAIAGSGNTATGFIRSGNGRVNVPYVAALGLGDGPFSLEAWVRPSLIVGNNNLGVIGMLNGYYMRVDTTTLELVYSQNAVIVSSAAGIVPSNGVFHHCVAVRDTTSNTHIYVDGVEVGGSVTSTTILNPAVNIGIGTEGNGNFDPFDGALDEVAIYNVVLSAQQVLDHYNYGIGTARRFRGLSPVVQAVPRAAVR